jgi:hypothetical protein
VAIKLNLKLDFVIKAFKLYKIICKYYELKSLSMHDFQKDFSNILSNEDQLIRGFSVVMDFITDTYDLESNSFSKESLKVFELLEEITGIENIKEKSITEISELLKAVQDETKEALTENFTQD